MRDEYLSLLDKLREGDYDDNIRRLKYKFKNFSKAAIEKLKEKSSMVDILLEDQEQLESSPSPPEPVKGIKAVKEEPSISSIGYKRVKHRTSRSKEQDSFERCS